MGWIEAKYVGILSSRLRNFKRKGPNLWNFSCHICGDSLTNKNKSRGYLFEEKGNLRYHCHNCNAHLSFDKFVKSIDNNVYNEMVLEKLKEKKSDKQLDLEEFVNKMKKPVFLQSGPLKKLKKVSQLSPENRIKKFVESRKLPTRFHAKLFECPNFKYFTNQLIPNKFDKDSLDRDETRLLIPFLNKEKKLHAFQGRVISKSEPKYITIILDDTVPKVYGLDEVDYNETIYVHEAAFDAMFVSNSVATAGGDLVSSVQKLPKDKLVICYDNEKRNKQTIEKIEKAIYFGYSVLIWPENFKYKDINDAVMDGVDPAYVEHIIKSNVFKDLKAQLQFNFWKKV